MGLPEAPELPEAMKKRMQFNDEGIELRLKRAALKEGEDTTPQHHKITNYFVVINDAQQTTWEITTQVTHPRNLLRSAFNELAEDCEVRIEGVMLVIVKKGEEWGITMKLPKNVDVTATPLVIAGCQTLYVTLPKINATEPPAEISHWARFRYASDPEGTLWPRMEPSIYRKAVPKGDKRNL